MMDDRNRSGWGWIQLSIILILAITGCKSLGATFPRPYDMPYATPEDAPPEWKKGWEHGCKSGLSAYGNDWYKTWYRFEQDTTLLTNPNYSKAWLDAFNYCRQYINRYLAAESLNPERAAGVFSTHDLNIKPGDLRGDVIVTKKSGMEPPMWQGLDAPGWGKNGWGADVPCESDWLGRKPANCGWMGAH